MLYLYIIIGILSTGLLDKTRSFIRDTSLSSFIRDEFIDSLDRHNLLKLLLSILLVL
jgi:hypothetical protein